MENTKQHLGNTTKIKQTVKNETKDTPLSLSVLHEALDSVEVLKINYKSNEDCESFPLELTAYTLLHLMGLGVFGGAWDRLKQQH